MITDPLLLSVGLLCIAAFAAIWLWQTPGVLSGRISATELERYLGKVRNATMPDAEKADLLARLREWGESDDGKPVFMLNLMRYHDEVRRFDGAPAFSGTPRHANAHYEKSVMPIAVGGGAYPLAAGTPQGRNTLIVGARNRDHDVVSAANELDHWGRVILMRYPNRRAFFKLITNPRYLTFMPYKLMALQVVLVPVSTDIKIPELRWLAGGVLLALFLAAGWARAALGH